MDNLELIIFLVLCNLTQALVLMRLDRINDRLMEENKALRRKLGDQR